MTNAAHIMWSFVSYSVNSQIVSL